jgi:type II secretory pathway component PulF
MTTSDAEPSPAALPAKASWSWGASASNAEAAEFAEHLAALTRTGLPLPSGLRSLAAELPSRRLGGTLVAMAQGLERGESLDAAMVSIAGRFPAPLRGLMVAGSRSGKLADVLGQYVRYANLGASLRRRFWISASYPAFLLAALAGLYVFLCFWIVEAFEFVLKDFGIDPPAVTQLFFMMAEVTRTRGPAIVTLAAVLGAIGYLVFRLSMGPAHRRMLVSSIPLFGPILRWSSLAEFCHLAGLLVESEMPLPDALELAGRGAADAELARAGESLRTAVEEGWTFADALDTWPRCPAGLIEVLADSEGRGDLAPSLHLAGDMFEARARSTASFLSTFVAAITLLIILWGGAFVVTALYLPLINLTWRLAG